jgi:hypothetical protein
MGGPCAGSGRGPAAGARSRRSAESEPGGNRPPAG